MDQPTPPAKKSGIGVTRATLIAIALVLALVLLAGWRQLYDAVNNTNTAGGKPGPAQQLEEQLINTAVGPTP